MYIMDNAVVFWLFTFLCIIFLYFFSKMLCDCYNNKYSSNRERIYLFFNHKSKEMIPVIKIDQNNA